MAVTGITAVGHIPGIGAARNRSIAFRGYTAHIEVTSGISRVGYFSVVTAAGDGAGCIVITDDTTDLQITAGIVHGCRIGDKTVISAGRNRALSMSDNTTDVGALGEG